nr:ribonuclease H [Tanacetum cinerariifolium]
MPPGHPKALLCACFTKGVGAHGLVRVKCGSDSVRRGRWNCPGDEGATVHVFGGKFGWGQGFYFIKEHVENGVIELYIVNTEYQLADIFTKALGRERYEFLINKLGMRSFTLETLKQLADEVEE